MIQRTWRQPLLVIGIVLAVVIPVGGMLVSFACIAWPVVSGAGTQEALVEGRL